MIRSCLLAIVTLGTGAIVAHAQEPAPADVKYPPRAIYIEAGGLPAFEAAPYSLNVEQRLLPHSFLRLGAFYGPVNSELTLKLPILLNVVVPQASHNLEVGAGVRWDVFGAESEDVRLGATVGYRYQELPGHSVVRAGLAFELHDLSGDSDAWTFRPWPFLSIGLAF
jgi:hypothetical protein